ncbi:YlxR family protein [Pseudoclavibacter alba]|uniref:YlxR family protein n=1 Tax=Pseudoclavibacter albus TaxID=272241 RepID=A0ABT2HWY0_9MICO|nr:YlxR family protein [Pseudoclavibacter alba]MCT2042829.1 YlxR family protein [Pseudoclavibacter alba]
MEPVRTCVGCRARAPRPSLVRVTAGPDRFLVDLTASNAGRGAWLHPDSACIQTALTRKALQRALRVRALDESEVGELAAQLAASAALHHEKADRNMDNS